jgi:hypothetical protein
VDNGLYGGNGNGTLVRLRAGWWLSKLEWGNDIDWLPLRRNLEMITAGAAMDPWLSVPNKAMSVKGCA